MYHLYKSFKQRKYQALLALLSLVYVISGGYTNHFDVLTLLNTFYLGYFSRTVYLDVLFSIQIALISIDTPVVGRKGK